MSEGKVEQWIKDLVEACVLHMLQCRKPITDERDHLSEIIAAHAPSPSSEYERGVRDAVAIVGRSHAAALQFLESAILALLQANPYRAVVETEAKR